MEEEVFGLYDVTMGSNNGSEVCELVGMFALSQLPKRYNRYDIRLYRNDGLKVFRGCQKVWQSVPRRI